MVYLFLDFDGVLNQPPIMSNYYNNSNHHIFDERKVEMLANYIRTYYIQKNKKVQIIITSTRRFGHVYISGLLKLLLNTADKSMFTLQIQPYPNSEDAIGRSSAIVNYVLKYGIEPDDWVAVDDLPLNVFGRNIKTETDTGLTHGHILKLFDMSL